MRFLGLSPLIYPTADIDTSRKWWADFLGIEDVGEGIMITHLVSPKGDRFGLIVNPYFKVDGEL